MAKSHMYQSIYFSLSILTKFRYFAYVIQGSVFFRHPVYFTEHTCQTSRVKTNQIVSLSDCLWKLDKIINSYAVRCAYSKFVDLRSSLLILFLIFCLCFWFYSLLINVRETVISYINSFTAKICAFGTKRTKGTPDQPPLNK